jgi:hypothetical protein
LALRRKPITQDSRSNVQKIGQKLTGSFKGKATLPYKEGQVVSTRLKKPFGPDLLKFAYEKKGTTVTKVSKYKPKGSPKKRVTGMASVAPKMSKAMGEPKPLSPRDVAKGLGRKTPPSKRVGPGTPKQPSMPRRSGDFRDMGPRKPPARPMPKRIGGAAIPKPAQRPMPKRIGDLRDMTPRKPPARPMPKRIGTAVVPKAKASRSMRSMY